MAYSAAGWKAGLCTLPRRGVCQALRRPGCRFGPAAGPALSVPVEVPGKFCLPLISSSGLGANTNADRLDGCAVLSSVPLSLPHPGVAAAVMSIMSMHWRPHCPLSSDPAPGPTDGGLAHLHHRQVPQGFHLPPKQHAMKGPFQCFFLVQSLPPPSPKNQSSPRRICTALDRPTDRLPGAILPASRLLGHSAQHGYDPAEALLL